MQDLAGAHEVFQGPQAFFNGCFRIPFMQEIDIQPIRVQAAQTVFNRAGDVAAVGATVIWAAFAERHADLGGDDQLVPFRRDQTPQNFFRAATIVNIRTVKEGDARISARGIQAARLRLVRITAKGHGAKA